MAISYQADSVYAVMCRLDSTCTSREHDLQVRRICNEAVGLDILPAGLPFHRQL